MDSEKPCFLVVSSLFLLVFIGPPARANTFLYGASPYNLFVRNNLTFGGPDSVGAIAAGGNITLGANVSIASGYQASTFPNPALAAGGLLSCPNQCQVNGNIYAGAESGTIYDNTPGFVNKIGGTSPIDFADNFAKLQALSTWLAGKATTAGDVCTEAYGTLTCTASASGMNVINLGAYAAYLGTDNLVFNIASGATLVLNVDGAAFSALGNAGKGFSVTDKQKLLFNYSSTSSQVNVGGTIDGSVLAPWAAVTETGNGQFTGNLIARSFSGQGLEFENNLFNGDLPEPGTVTMLGGGLLLLFAARRMRH